MKYDLMAHAVSDAVVTKLRTVADYINRFAVGTNLGQKLQLRSSFACAVVNDPLAAASSLGETTREILRVMLYLEGEIIAEAKRRSPPAPKPHEPFTSGPACADEYAVGVPELDQSARKPVPQSDRTGA